MNSPRSLLWAILLSTLACCRQRDTRPAPAAQEETPAQKDRRDLMLQSRRDWKPEDAARKLTLLLVSQKTSILKGEGFRYRLELKNVGREAIAVQEPSPSFIKDGVACEARGWRFYVTPPGQSERSLKCLPASAAGPAPTALELTLQPGDYLLTRRESPAMPFREMKTAFRFDKTGAYRIRAVYAHAGLRAESNPVVMSVVR